MIGSVIPALLWLCAILAVAQATVNGTDLLHPIIETKLQSTIPSPLRVNTTWPPFTNISKPLPIPGPPLNVSQPSETIPTKSFVTVNVNNTSLVNGQTDSPTTDASYGTTAPTHHPVTQTSATSKQTAVVSQSWQSTSSVLPLTTAQKGATTNATVPTVAGGEGHVSLIVFLAVPVCAGLLISSIILFGKYCRKKLRLEGTIVINS